MADKEKVILFGRGMVYRRKKAVIFEKYDVVLFLDNEIKNLERVIDGELGINVVNPVSVLEYPEYPIILLSYAVGDMSRQLLELGIARERIRFGVCIPPFNTFERMLFGDQEGRICLNGQDIIYQNDKYHLSIVTDPSNLENITKILRDTPIYPHSRGMLDNLPLYPIDDTYGMNRGTPIDRYYIEQFLQANRTLIKGTVMEIGDREYTLRYGNERVQKSIVLHVLKGDMENNIVCGDLVTGEGIEEESIDCLICTQTLPFIYDIHAAAKNIVRMLKKGGTALITVGGISQIIAYERAHFGHYWSFTDMSLQRLFEGLQGVKKIDVNTYGNVKAASAFLYGVSCEEMEEEDLQYSDFNYQLIITAVVKKES